MFEVLKKIVTQRKWLVPLLTALFLFLTDQLGLNLNKETFWGIVILVVAAVTGESLKDAAAHLKQENKS